jgi:hypothetical protein
MHKSSLTLPKMLLLITFLLAAAACTESQPSDDLARETWIRVYGPQYIQQEGHELVEFKKVNGVAGEVSGIKVYEYDFEVKIRCKKDAFIGFEFSKNECKSGEIVSRKGRFNFRKTENGWQKV